MKVRPVDKTEVDRVAQLWFDGWRDAHERIVPAELTRMRTLQSFRDRLRAARSAARVVGPRGAPIAFYMLKDDELYQFYVSAQSRGTGIAAALIADAERRLADSGVSLAWLACAIGNDRAARFYEKCGWRRAGTIDHQFETPQGHFRLDVWRYEKRLTRASK
jgi:GNAT superfamily N-acetyltransferase